jgi:hypothetical protein
MSAGTQPGPLRIAGEVFYWLVLCACGVLPWVLHFTVAWWAGLLSFFPLVALYDRLFVPKGSVCMGIPFGLALGSFLGLFLLDVLLLFRWLFAWAS